MNFREVRRAGLRWFGNVRNLTLYRIGLKREIFACTAFLDKSRYLH